VLSIGRISQSKLSRLNGITQKQLSALEAGNKVMFKFVIYAKLVEPNFITD